MNLRFLDMGWAGAFEAGLIALLAGFVLYGLVHLGGRAWGWSPAREVGWAFVFTLVIACGADSWHLVYMGIVPLESPVTIRRILERIHDPDYLGVRVVVEVIGASLGVVLGWLLLGGALRRHLRGGRSAGPFDP